MNGIDKNFFVIDSKNLDDVNTKLYGYAISQDQIFTESDLIDNILIDGTGAYVYISVIDDKINIYQDINGCFGIYVYNTDQFFAISNSFAKLVNHLKDKCKLTLNHDYSISYLTSDVCAYDIDETLINEITILPRNVIVEIDKKKKEIKYNEIDYEENTISLNSFEGIKILDEWYYKWENILNNIYAKTDNISFDLSGGMDSRGIITLLFSSDLNYQQFNINSHVADKPNYVVANEIAEGLDFTLNKNLDVDYTYAENLESYFGPSILTKSGSIKLLFPNSKIPNEPIYKFTGYGGACIRGYPKVSVDAHSNFIYQNARKYSQEYGDLMKIKDEENFNKLNERYSPENKDYLPALAHKEVRARYIHGKTMVEKFCANYIYLAPYFDPLFYKLKLNDEDCEDTNLLITLVYDRYFPQLLDYPLDSGRKISKGTIKHAKYINTKYPFIKDKTLLKSPQKIPNNKNTKDFPVTNKNLKETVSVSFGHTLKFIHNLFTSQSFKNTFNKYFSENIYKKALADLEKENVTMTSIRDVFSVIAVIRAIMDTEYTMNKNDSLKSLNDFFDNTSYKEYGSKLSVEKLSFEVPDEFWINSDSSITNDKITINFRCIGLSDRINLNKRIEKYISDIKKDNGIPLQDSFNINNIQVQKVINTKSCTTRYWFEKNGHIYHIYTYSKDKYLDSIIKYILNSVKDEIIIIENILFKLPPSFWVKDSESITNGKSTFFFKFTIVGDDSIDSMVKSYKRYIKHENGEIEENSFNINNLKVYKVKNTKSSTTRCWFEKNNIIYQIFTYSKESDVDDNIRFLIENLS